MPRRLDEALAAVTPYAARHGEQSTLDALHTLRDTYAGWCAELAASGIPDSIDHNDLHAANILVDGAGVRFYDWGDAVVAHPFACLLPVTANLPAAAAERTVDPHLKTFEDPQRLRG